MKILVKYRNSSYFWVDTVVVHDKNDLDYPCAVLVSSDGSVLSQVDPDDILVVDDDYLNH